MERLTFTEDTVHEACAELYLRYGTTLAGLVATGHTIDFEDWHREVHGRLPYAELLSKDDELRAMLNSIEAPLWVFTNADQVSAARALYSLDACPLSHALPLSRASGRSQQCMAEAFQHCNYCQLFCPA